MNASAVSAIRKAVRSALSADASLIAKLGGARIYDEAPRGVAAPYLQFGDVSSRDWSTTSDAGAEHVLHLHVWSMQQGLKEALEIAADAQRILDDSALTLGGHRLVSIQYVSTESRREQSGRFARISLRFRAVTEPI